MCVVRLVARSKQLHPVPDRIGVVLATRLGNEAPLHQFAQIVQFVWSDTPLSPHTQTRLPSIMWRSRWHLSHQGLRENQVEDNNAAAQPVHAPATVWNHTHEIHENEQVLLKELRQLRRDVRQEAREAATGEDLTTGQRVADTVAEMMGSWAFIIIQSLILAVWVVLNIIGWIKAWDPYPFILLNLALSFQAAYAAPIIMMSQNRQQDIDRKAAENDYRINIKAELEIELLHHKLDSLREQEVLELSKAVRELTELLAAKPSA